MALLYTIYKNLFHALFISCFLIVDIIPSSEYNIIYTERRLCRMKYISTSEAGKKWNISARRVGVLCSNGRIKGAQKAGANWIIPENAEKPADARIKSGKYVKNREDSNS
jgi:hypothetical protein